MSSSTSSPPSVRAMFRHVERTELAAKPFAVLDDRCLTYGVLGATIERTARLFFEAGVRQGDRVVICSELELEVIALYLACMRLGVTPTPIDPKSSPDEAVTLVAAARARAVFADPQVFDLAPLGQHLLEGGVCFRMVADACFPAPGCFDRGVTERDAYPAVLRGLAPLGLPADVPAEVSGFILFTSGTTSRPKGVEVSLGAIAAHMATMHRQYGYAEDSVVINGLPLHHSDGINHGAVNIMTAGGTLVRTGRFSVHQLPDVLALVSRHRATHMITVPTVLALISRLGQEFDGAFRTPHFRFVSSTAGPLDERLWRGFERRFGTMVVNSYGLTETVCEGLYCGPTPDTRRIGTVGKPVDIDARIVDSDGHDVASGEIGELVLRGSCVMKGYFNAPEETAAVLRGGWLYTGDLAVRDEDGFYSIAGRKKNVILRGGINVYPEDVSRTLARMPGVREVVTLGMPDEAWGERVVSCVVLESANIVAPEAIADYGRAHLAPEKVPSQVVILEDLPRGPAGKVALPQLRRIVGELFARAESRVAVPADVDHLERQVFETAARVFKVDVSTLSRDSDPESTQGWNSLGHMDFVLALESAFGVRIEPNAMLGIVTLGDAIEYLRAMLKVEAESG